MDLPASPDLYLQQIPEGGRDGNPDDDQAPRPSIHPRNSRGPDRRRLPMKALVIGARGAVGRATADTLTAAGAHVVSAGHERDATDPAQAAALLREADPDLVVIAAGARPRM